MLCKKGQHVTLPVRKPTKALQIQHALMRDIIEGKYACGEKLSMDALKSDFGAAYSVLREALMSLASCGLVEREQQCGFRVTPLSLAELHDLYGLRCQLEIWALQLAIENGDLQWESEVLATWHVYEKFLKRTTKQIDIKQWMQYHDDLRFVLIKACNSSWLLKTREMLHHQAERYRMLCYQNSNKPLRLQKILEINRKLVNATLAKDTSLAIQTLQTSWQQSMHTISQTLTKLLKQTPDE